MNIKFIGTIIKQDYEEDFMKLIGENIQKKVNEEYEKTNLIFSYLYLSNKIHDIQIKEQDEVLSTHISFKIKKNEVYLVIKKNSYKEDRVVVFVNINIKSEENENDILDEFIYNVKVIISRAVSKYTGNIYWIMDEQNEEISKFLYIKVHSLENKFRSIINMYMLNKYGEDWFKKKIIRKFDEKTQKYNGWYNKNYERLNYIKGELFNLQTNDLIEILKSSYENEETTKIIENINTIKSLLKEKATKVIKKEILDEENLWNRYFVDIFNSDIEQKWKKFSEMRNTIAHNKIISKEFFNDTVLLISEIDEIFDNTNIILEKKMKTLEDEKINDYIKRLDLESNLSNIDFKDYNNEKQVIEDIFSNGELNSLYSLLEEKNKNLIDEYKELIKALREINLYYEEEKVEIKLRTIDDEEEKEEYLNSVIEDFSDKLKVINNKVNYENKEIISILLRKKNDISELNEIGAYLMEFINKMIDKIYSWINGTTYSNDFKDGINILEFYNMDNDIFNLSIEGWFVIELGSVDEIFFEYKKNQVRIDIGRIDISFGDYSMHEDGYSLPEKEQSIKIRIDNIYEAIENDVDDIISAIRKYIDDIQVVL
ncbi:prominin family protein [Clostridium sp. YIM B02506]|uniref:prominin family protein n=1 Tax=Clostridium sp. YIM B02506 TaxID=2910680 RepID=UPI001EEF6BD9|nr:prominin family protein [Clostridium sp. YIM B02506]